MTITSLLETRTARAEEAANAGNIPFRLRLSMFTFGLLSNLGPDHVLFLPLSILGIFSGLINYSWQREIALRGEELSRGAFLHTGGDPNRSKRSFSAGFN